jgi:outer membrane biosynthesis protein TonB
MLPPPKRRGPLYVVGFLLVAGGLIAYWQLSSESDAESPVSTAVESVIPDRQTRLAGQSFIISETPDAASDGSVDDAATDGSRTRNRRGPAATGCTGTLNAALARRYISRHRGAVRSCYERRLKTVNNLQGQVLVDLRVGTGGQVSRVRVRGSLRDPEVFSCIRNTVSQWRLPSPEGGCANLQVPFSFTPRP